MKITTPTPGQRFAAHKYVHDTFLWDTSPAMTRIRKAHYHACHWDGFPGSYAPRKVALGQRFIIAIADEQNPAALERLAAEVLAMAD